MIVHLIRHQKVEGTEGLCYGRTDVPLAAGHEKLTAQLHGTLPRGVRLVWTSPALRCRRMAACLAPLVRVETRFAELDFGEWEGRRWDDLSRPDIDEWAADPVNRRPPGGESFAELHDRACAAMNHICALAAGAMPVVCTHAGVIRALLAEARGIPLAEALSVEVPYGSVHALDWKERGAK